MLTTALARSPPDADLIYEAMKDRMHQPYRMALVGCLQSETLGRMLMMQIPGLPEILSSLTYTSHPGLLGICLSGAGPTILALATENFDHIAGEIQRIFGEHGVQVDWEVLDIYEKGSWVEEVQA